MNWILNSVWYNINGDGCRRQSGYALPIEHKTLSLELELLHLEFQFEKRINSIK